MLKAADLWQLHTYWDALHGGSGTGALAEEGQSVQSLAESMAHTGSSRQWRKASELDADLDEPRFCWPLRSYTLAGFLVLMV